MKLLSLLLVAKSALAAQTHPHCVKLADQMRNDLAMCWGCRNNPAKLAAHQVAMRPLKIKYYCECTDATFKQAKCAKYSYYADVTRGPVVYPRIQQKNTPMFGERRRRY